MWPPILVRRQDNLVIDGAHRVAAARLLGMTTINAALFDGEAEEALIEFVRRNVSHGLPLTLRERKRAACQVLQAQPGWSDRRIASLCAISPKTVARLRAPAGRPTEEIPHLDARARLGADGRLRPINSAHLRALVVDALRDQPSASLRSVAASVGVSPETVRSVRAQLEQVEDSPPGRRADVWRDDVALASSNEGDDFVRWFEQTAVAPGIGRERAGAVPLSRIYEVADEARRRAAIWTEFARTLEARAKRN
jgi:ParB-like chromosome segregation protein Spo0J